MRHHTNALALVTTLCVTGTAHAQTATAPPPIVLAQPGGTASPPAIVTLADALERARQNDAQFNTASADAESARQESVQARAALLPAVTGTTQFLGNQPNGVNPNGRFVSMDGVRMYRAWGVVRQDVSASLLTATTVRRARALEAAAAAQRDIAERGLAVTVTRAYYTLVAAQRKYATAQESARQAARFLEVARQQQGLGQVAMSDVIKAEIQSRQQTQSFNEAALAADDARLAVAVLVFPGFSENFTVVDDLSASPLLPAFSEVSAMAGTRNPNLKAAQATLAASSEDVRAARQAFFPTLTIEADYGIEANEFALHSRIAAQPELGVLPNLGYAITANLTIPVWDWGAQRSRLKQAEVRAKSARTALSQAQREAIAGLYSRYNNALVARSAAEAAAHIAELAGESLRLTNLRYGAGESTALEVVDAQNTLVQARNASDDAGTRYRVALAELQTLTGGF